MAVIYKVEILLQGYLNNFNLPGAHVPKTNKPIVDYCIHNVYCIYTGIRFARLGFCATNLSFVTTLPGSADFPVHFTYFCETILSNVTSSHVRGPFCETTSRNNFPTVCAVLALDAQNYWRPMPDSPTYLQDFTIFLIQLNSVNK